MERTFIACDKSLSEAMAFLESELESQKASPKDTMLITTSFEEMFVNVAHYAYPNGQGDVKIDIDCFCGVFIIVITDKGIPFNPLEKPDPNINLPAEEREIGGLGIYMVKKSMDEVFYERVGDKNVFTMKKKIN